MTFILCLGKPVWPYFNISKKTCRISFGPISFWVLFYDLGFAVEKIFTQRDRQILGIE